MKAILEFNLPEDNEEFQMAANASGWKHVVSIVANHLRNQLKYGGNLSTESVHSLTAIRNELNIALEENNISLD